MLFCSACTPPPNAPTSAPPSLLEAAQRAQNFEELRFDGFQLHGPMVASSYAPTKYPVPTPTSGGVFLGA
jgi:hypothetical protein